MKEKIGKNNLSSPTKSMIIDALIKAGSKSKIAKSDLPAAYKGTVKHFKFIFDKIQENKDSLITYKDEMQTLAERVNQKSPFINELQGK